MSAVRTAGVLVVAVLAIGGMNGGVVTNPDGSVNGKETLNRSAELGMGQVGDTLDSTAEAAGRGAASGVGSSKVLAAGALGAAAYGAAKYGPKIKSRYSSCWQRKSCDGSPMGESEKPAPTLGEEQVRLIPGLQLG